MNLFINNADPQLCIPIKHPSLEGNVCEFSHDCKTYLQQVFIYLKGLLHSLFNESNCFCGNRCELKWQTDPYL